MGGQRELSSTDRQDQSGKNGVRFLSQRFVERLCSDDHVGTELVSEIEAVVFSYLDPTDTLNASSSTNCARCAPKASDPKGSGCASRW